MCRTGICRFGVGNWIFLLGCLHLFTYAQGGEDNEPGVVFTHEPSDAVLAAGEAGLLPCAASSRRALRIAWRFSTDPIPTRDHVLTDGDKTRRQLANGSLLIESMSSSLVGQYQCVAIADGIGTILSRVATLFLAEVPEVSGGPRSVLGAAGGAALLPCGVRAAPRLALRLDAADAPPDRRVYGSARLHHAPPTLKLNVTWLKDGSPLRVDGTRMSITPGGALEIDPLHVHDAARYACRVALLTAPDHYKTSEETELRVSAEAPSVESPPRFIATPQPVTVIEGASVTFDCAAVGNPKPEMTWLNNGAAIDLSDLDSRFHLCGHGSLRIVSARALDAGAYTCRAHNNIDSADHTTTLTVLTPPRAVLPGGALAAAHARGDVTLACEPRGRPAPAVTWLKDGDPLTPNNHDIALVDGASLRIRGVLPVDSGMFQCRAASGAGVALAALRLRVLPPDDDLTNVTINSTHSHEVFTSLISTDSDHTLDPSPADPDFLGETSSAYTSKPLQYDYSDGNDFDGNDVDGNESDGNDYDDDYDDFHAAEGLDVGNGSHIPAPRNLRAVIVKHRFVTLSWEEPGGGEGEDVTGYAVVYKVKGSERERVSRGGAARHEMNVASLQPNTTYVFCVRAYSARGVSPPTPPIEVQTPAEEVLFGPPLRVRVVAAGPHALRVSWDPPARAAPNNYTLHYSEVGSGREQMQYVSGGASGTISSTLSGLRAGARYVVRVAGVGPAGAGGAPAEATGATPPAPPAQPPHNVSATHTSATSILVRWEAPPSRSVRGPLTGYKVRYRAAPGTGATGPRRKADSLTTPADQRRAELRGLETATTYQIRVCALNTVGSGPWSEWVSAATPRHDLDETSVPLPPPALTTRAGRDWISVWWGGGGGASGGSGAGGGSGGSRVVRGYVVGWGLGVPDESSRELPHSLHSHVIRGLESNSEYVISLRASNARGLGPAVYSTVRTKPASDDELEDDDEDEVDDEEDEEEADEPPLIPPVGVKVIMLSGTTAVVYWTDPSLPKGQGATDGRRYVVRWAGGGLRARTYNATDLNCMLDDLRPHTTYEFAVKLIKGGRESAWSMLVSNTTLEVPPASPPRELRAAPPAPPANPARAVDLQWAPPAKPNGVITGYVIMYAVSGSGNEEWTSVSAAGERTRARIERLRARTHYLFKLQAKNSKGLGPFCAPVTITTAIESGEGGGLAAATSAWLWASAGGACAVLALAAALALSLCCRRAPAPLSPDTSTYQKSSASAGIKPPDLWIHHDQMELKHLDKSLHSSASKISAGSTEGALMSSTLTLRAPPAEYEPARRALPGDIDRRHGPAYVESRSTSAAGSEDTARLCRHCDYMPTSMTGPGSVSCASTCERRHAGRMHADQSTPLLGGVALSPQSHPPPAPCGSGTCPLGAACSAPGGAPGHIGGHVVGPGGDIYASAARERGHYVAYEPLGHYTHRDSLSSEAGTGMSLAGMSSLSHLPGMPPVPGVPPAPGGSLRRTHTHTSTLPAPLHSFALSDNASDHSTPTHSHSLSRGSVRETSPYKKSASSSPGHLPNRLHLGGSVSQCAEELEPLTPSRSTERLQREMHNLEGLMKDLSALTQQQFHC